MRIRRLPAAVLTVLVFPALADMPAEERAPAPLAQHAGPSSAATAEPEQERPVTPEERQQEQEVIDKAEQFAKDHPIEGLHAYAAPVHVDGGLTRVEIRYQDGLDNIHYLAVVDASGQVTGPELTGLGKVYKYLRDRKMKIDSDVMNSWMRFKTDIDTFPFIHHVKVIDENRITRIDVEFNENGDPYRGTFRDEDGNVTSRFDDPNRAPDIRDKGPPLETVDLIRLVTQPCEPCRSLNEARNEVARQLNELGLEINHIVARHQEWAGPAQIPLRYRHEFLIEQWRALKPKLDELDGQLDACERQCVQAATTMALAAPGVSSPPTPRGEPVAGAGGDDVLTLNPSGQPWCEEGRPPGGLGELRCLNPERANAAEPDATTQLMETVVDEIEDFLVISQATPEPPALLLTARNAWTVLARLMQPRGLALGAAPGPELASREAWRGTAGPHGEPEAFEGQSAPGASGDRPNLKIVLVSLGVSTGEAFEMHIVNEGPRPVRITGGSFVVEPLKQQAQRELQKQLQGPGARKPVVAMIDGYCLEFLGQPPTRGAIFRIAGPELQQKFAHVSRIVDASRRLRDAGVLRPDSDPTGYFHSIRQWAIWAKEQKFTLETFKRAFVEHTKKNVLAVGQPWKKEMEKTVEGLVPHRWEEILAILKAAEQPPAAAPR